MTTTPQTSQVLPRSSARVALLAVGEVMLLWITAAALLLALYELVDRLFLQGLPPDSRASAGVLRGLAVSLTASVATAFYVLFRRVPSLQATLGGRAETEAQVPPERDEARLSSWLLWLRWVAVVALCGVLVATTTGRLYVAEAAVGPLWGGLIALLVCNSVLSLLHPEFVASQRMLLLQLLIDAGVLGWMLHHAGGLSNPFSGFFVFIAVIAAIVLEERLARRVVNGLALSVFLLAVLEATEILAPLCTMQMGGGCSTVDRLHLAATGTGVVVLVFGCPLFVLSLVSSLRRERTWLARAHESVLEEREKLRSIIDCMADAVIYADSKGSIGLHNQAALSLWGGDVPPAHSLHVCHDTATWERLLSKVSAPEHLEEHPLLRAHGRCYEATYAPVQGASGRLVGVVMIARDVTERLRQEQSRIRNERLAVVGRMAASLAHEINNPLTAIQLFTQHAQKQFAPDHPLYAQLGTVKRNADLCGKIVGDLLSYARQRNPERRSVDLWPLLEDVARTASYRAVRSNIEVELLRESDAPTVAYCDRDQLLQVLLNVGLNGIEAMDMGGKLTLRLCARHPDEVCISISDTGPGIPMEQREQIWEAFYTTKSEGTGLGLAVARNLVEAHSGRIELHSELGVGTTFRIVLPSQGAAAGAERFARSDVEHEVSA